MTEEQKPYRVLARKYRPKNFDELIGQDALVRTLTNAINSGRIAHAFMLTGIRGTGKTTTARIIAKALNYRGPDGNAGPTTGSTDDCETCKAITEDRHPDVMEMDAASRTGVDDIREILDGVRYAPTSARYKVYIIDEVHMLSKAAFNALLKTLEEPPEHVIFIFATTEIRKVPVTVLSRCQRFDLRRIDAQTLADYYGTICEKEGVKAEKEALLMIGRAADGSVRDGLSLLDQAISLAGMEGSDGITATQVQDMLGLADRTLVLGMLESALKGECGKALDTMAALYEKAADPVVLINDMLDFTHLMTRLRAVPDMKDAQSVMAQDALEAAADLAGKLSMPTLGRAWQILLKGLQEVNQAPSPQAAAEMILIRLAYAADLPDPAELIKKINSGEGNIGGGTPPSGGGATTGSSAAVSASVSSASGQAQALAAPQPQEMAVAVEVPKYINDLHDVEAILTAHNEIRLASEVHLHVHLITMKKGVIEMALHEEGRPEMPQLLGKALTQIMDERWVVTVSNGKGQPTLVQQAQAIIDAEIEEAKKHPVVSNVLEFFPQARVTVKDAE
ncbi:MAG TPA: DNA polymerase III subunit gamma/tau [Micavibrio sp.]|nr:DNA polymerase III subunit gamma/tau [Micavibrio sp.]